MAVKVIDTSALAAVACAEPDDQRISAQLEEHDVIAPHLLRFSDHKTCMITVREKSHGH